MLTERGASTFSGIAPTESTASDLEPPVASRIDGELQWPTPAQTAGAHGVMQSDPPWRWRAPSHADAAFAWSDRIEDSAI